MALQRQPSDADEDGSSAGSSNLSHLSNLGMSRIFGRTPSQDSSYWGLSPRTPHTGLTPPAGLTPMSRIHSLSIPTPGSVAPPQHVRQLSLPRVSSDGFENMELGMPPTMPVLQRNHSLTVPASAHQKSMNSLGRIPSDVSINQPPLNRISTAEIAAESPGLPQGFLPSRTSSADGTFFGDSPGVQAERIIPPHRTMAANMDGPTQTKSPSPEDLLLLLTPGTTFDAGKATSHTKQPKREPQATKPKETTRKRNSRGRSKNQGGKWVCEYVDPKTKQMCGSSFARRNGLLTHKRIHTDSKMYKCKFPNCIQAFTTSALRTIHERSKAHAGQRVRSYKCDWVDPQTGAQCPKAYTHSRSLIEHKCKHYGTFLHQCEDCGKKFTVNSNFKRHRDKVDCKAKMEKKRLKELREAEKKAKKAAMRPRTTKRAKKSEAAI